VPRLDDVAFVRTPPQRLPMSFSGSHDKTCADASGEASKAAVPR